MANGTINIQHDNIYEATTTINADTETRFLVYVKGNDSTGLPPVTGNGYLITFVREIGQTALQFFIGVTSNTLYQRVQYSSSWKEWKSITFS